ncbi:MAG: penicillin-binding protein 1C, partial [Bacteroidota bacterium]
QEDWYRRKHADYRSIPPYRADCRAVAEAESAGGNMEFIYPRNTNKVYVPVDLDGKLSSVVFEVAHRRDTSRIYWHLDQTYLGETKTFHQMALNPSSGTHILTLVDESGEQMRKRFEVIGKEEN